MSGRDGERNGRKQREDWKGGAKRKDGSGRKLREGGREGETGGTDERKGRKRRTAEREGGGRDGRGIDGREG